MPHASSDAQRSICEKPAKRRSWYAAKSANTSSRSEPHADRPSRCRRRSSGLQDLPLQPLGRTRRRRLPRVFRVRRKSAAASRLPTSARTAHARTNRSPGRDARQAGTVRQAPEKPISRDPKVNLHQLPVESYQIASKHFSKRGTGLAEKSRAIQALALRRRLRETSRVNEVDVGRLQGPIRSASGKPMRLTPYR